MKSFIIDMLLPTSDSVVKIQILIASLFWAVVLFRTRNKQKEAKLFLWGLAVITFAWFALRAMH